RAFAVRRDVEDLERALGRRAGAVVVGGTAGDGTLPAQLAQVLGRDVHVATGCHPVARAGAVLVGRALGAHAHVPGLPATVLPAGDPSPHAASYARWCEVRARPS
ncbi:MAG: hypothetical protein JWN08_2097, partial [Frankiales bacterium]|nr:hypothetical protein [Frankiales bacterium]